MPSEPSSSQSINISGSNTTNSPIAHIQVNNNQALSDLIFEQIGKNVDLSSEDINYIVNLIQEYIVDFIQGDFSEDNRNLMTLVFDRTKSNVKLSREDINYIVNLVQEYIIGFMQGRLHKIKIERIEDLNTDFRNESPEEKLRKEFSIKLDEATILINDLRTSIEHRLKDGNPKSDAAILRLLDELQSALGKESRIALIRQDLEFCKQGGNWLHENKHRLARRTKDYIFSQERIPMLLTYTNSKLTIEELEERFLQDIETYISWISIYLKTGMTPKSKDFSEGVFSVYLDFPDHLYKEAFETLNVNFTDPIVSGLSIEAANSTASYFNRFIIDRDLSKDSKVFIRNPAALLKRSARAAFFKFYSNAEIGSKYQKKSVSKFKLEEEQIANCLLDPKFDFRTVSGISASTGISKNKIYNILETATFSRKSMVSAKNGEFLYTHRRRRPSLREWLAATQRILSKPFLSMK